MTATLWENIRLHNMTKRETMDQHPSPQHIYQADNLERTCPENPEEYHSTKKSGLVVIFF